MPFEENDGVDRPTAEVFVPIPEAPVQEEHVPGATVFDFDPDPPDSTPNPNFENYQSESAIEQESANDDSADGGEAGGDDGDGSGDS